MSLNIKDFSKPKSLSGPKYTPEEGIQAAVIVQVVGLGLQEGREWKGDKKPDAHEVWITYELVDEVHDFDGEDKPLVISEQFKLSDSDMSTCYKRLNAIDPGLSQTGGDLSKLVGLPVAVQVVNKEGTGNYEGRTFSNVGSVAKPGKSMKIDTDTFNPQFFYDPYNHNDEVFNQLPEFLQDKVNSRLDKEKTDPSRGGKAESTDDGEW